MSKSLTKVIKAEQFLEGAGFKVNRPFPTRTLSYYDPFLMIDELGPVNMAPGEAKGAPWHPHRGFQTVSYFKRGQFQHQDSMGNKGMLKSGDIQWMTAGRGIIHDEMPTDSFLRTGGLMHGFQIWVNLPKKDKMCQPNYQDVPSRRIPHVDLPGGAGQAKVVAGSAFDQTGPVETIRPTQYVDFMLNPNAQVSHSVPRNLNALIYVYHGSLNILTTLKNGEIKKTKIGEKHMACFDAASEGGEMITIQAAATPSPSVIPEYNSLATGFLLMAGEPLNEPVARYGPFVMNTRQEIEQAFADYQNGTFATVSATVTSRTDSD